MKRIDFDEEIKTYTFETANKALEWSKIVLELSQRYSIKIQYDPIVGYNPKLGQYTVQVKFNSLADKLEFSLYSGSF